MELRYIGNVTGTMTVAAGVVACGNARKVNLQAILTSNAAYEVACKPVLAATGTCSKNDCAAVITDKGVYECWRPGSGASNWWIARRLYNGATAATGGANNRLIAEKLG